MQLTRLVDDLLDVTRISRGKTRLQREPVGLGEIVRRTVEDHRPALAAGGVSLEGRTPSRPLWLNADPAAGAPRGRDRATPKGAGARRE
jgi:signal transduction histidine kinase